MSYRLNFQFYNSFSKVSWFQDLEDYIAWVCDQDAYACSGQKCSAQSLLFMHKVNLIGEDENVHLLFIL